MTDHPPTRLFPWLNGLSLASTAGLIARATRAAESSRPAAALAAALAFLTFHSGLDPWFWFGSVEDSSRLIAPITKLLFLDLMPASFPLLTLVLWADVDGNPIPRMLGVCALLWTPAGAEAPALTLTPGIGIREMGWDTLIGFSAPGGCLPFPRLGRRGGEAGRNS